MPSRKKVSQRAREIAQLCPKSKTQTSGDLPLSHSLGDQEKLQAQPQPSAQIHEEGLQRSFVHLRSASQKSASTDEGSSSSGLSSEESTCSPVHGRCTSSNPEEFVRQSPADLSVQVCASPVPLWVANGLKGDEAAWLLVLPKFPEQRGDHTRQGAPKSPNDAVLLGPYVTTKNTFLDESRVGGGMRFPQRSRAQSLGALR